MPPVQMTPTPLSPLPSLGPSQLLLRLEGERRLLRDDLETLKQALKQNYITSREYALRSDDIHSRLFDIQRAIDHEVRAIKLQMAKVVMTYHQQRTAYGVGVGIATIEEQMPPLPEETAFGEVLGHRVWRLPLHGLSVTSCYRTDYIWSPGKIEEEKAALVRDRNAMGFHAWNNPNRAVGYAMSIGLGVVIGRVKLWGIVIHHQHGYRAQFAKIVSFDFVAEEACTKDDEKLIELRKAYGLEEAS